MLTVLSLRIMDNVWKKEGLDYGIIPYRCLSTGPMVGLIEVVPKSTTLSRIQAARGALLGTWNKDTFYLWLKEQVKATSQGLDDDEKLKRFIGNFTRSVVGYSVATYVLGVGDRHNDNIMMKKDTGQYFRINPTQYENHLQNIVKSLEKRKPIGASERLSVSLSYIFTGSRYLNSCTRLKQESVSLSFSFSFGVAKGAVFKSRWIEDRSRSDKPTVIVNRFTQQNQPNDSDIRVQL